MTTLALSALVRPLIEPRLPDDCEVHWFVSQEEAVQVAPSAEIGWFDMNEHAPMIAAVRAATGLKWLNSIYAGLDFLPLDLLAEREVVITNGAGINAITIAEYVVMGMLTIAKGYRDVVRAQERREWLLDSPGKRELAGSRALLLGYGAIGRLIQPRLAAFDVDVTVVRRSGGDDTLGPDEWRGRLGEFDWIILAVPATSETEAMIGADELAAMKRDAVLVNIARGSVVDQARADRPRLREKRIGGVFPRRDDTRTFARRPRVVDARQRACHHAPVGPGAGQDVRPRGGPFHGELGPLPPGRDAVAAVRSTAGLLNPLAGARKAAYLASIPTSSRQ